MHVCRIDIPRSLHDVLEFFPVRKYMRGELVIRALLTVARDDAVGIPDANGQPATRPDGASGRIISSIAFFRRLFKPLDTALLQSSDSSVHSKTEGPTDEVIRRFSLEYSTYNLHFNHFHSVGPDLDAFRWDLLLTLLVRGAAVSCEGHSHGVDAVLMMVNGFDVSSPEELCLVLIKSTRRTIRFGRFFACMDPYQLGLWAPDDQPRKPFIRIVFAPFAKRGSEQFSIGFKQTTTYCCYEIVATGLSASILSCIDAQSEDSWARLLLAS